MDLVVLAAGMGSRFGGLKQIQPVDEDNNFIIDYSVFDAVKAGFNRVIFIIKQENYDIFKSTIGKRLENIIEVKYVVQNMNDVPGDVTLPTDRVKPWGTAHAIYAVRDVVDEKFAIINADDFYGYDAYKKVAEFLKSNCYTDFANVGYYAKNTLSSKGTVKRGVFSYQNNYVTNLVESEIKQENGKLYATPLGKDSWNEIDDNTIVSMNLFGFTKKLIDRISEEIVKFFSSSNLQNAEFLLPDVVNKMVKDDSIKLKLLSTDSKWFGITYKDDLEYLKQAILDMKKQGKYPLKLYKN